MTYRLILDPEAESHIENHAKAGNKILLQRIHRLFSELVEHPTTGTGKPHRLRHEHEEVWSRRIDDRHRMVYAIDGNQVCVFVISLWGHYGDK